MGKSMNFKGVFYRLATILAIVYNVIAVPWQDYQTYPDTNYHQSKFKITILGISSECRMVL